MSESCKTLFLLVESSIERIPKELWTHPAVKADCKRRHRSPSKILLYTPIHYTAMIDNNIPPQKRGRPDILHRTLLILLDSPINKSGLLDIYIHTINDLIIWVNPIVRLPLDYYRFEGLIIQLLEKGRVPPEGSDIFLKILYGCSLKDLVKDRLVFLLTEKGERINRDILSKLIGNVIILGAFQEGDYRSDILELADYKISVSPYTHHASTVAGIITTLMSQYLSII